MRHQILDLTGGQAVLSGAISGRQLLSALIAATPIATTPALAFLDFTGVEVATSSFLRESVIGFRDFARQALPNVYPVAANLPVAVVEELDFFVRARNDALLACDLDTKGKVLVAYLIGELEPAQRATFDAVCEVGAISAPELATRFASLNIGPTAWNNRLSTLANKGLLIERRQGKTKSFSPLLEIA